MSEHAIIILVLSPYHILLCCFQMIHLEHAEPLFCFEKSRCLSKGYE